MTSGAPSANDRVRQTVAEGEAGRQLARVVPAVPHQHAFAVAHLTVLAGEVAERRVVLEPPRERGREAATGFGVAGQHVGRARWPSPARRTTPARPRARRRPTAWSPARPCSPRPPCCGWRRRPAPRVRPGGPGRSMVSRSCPSLSQSSLVPTITTTASAVGRGRRWPGRADPAATGRRRPSFAPRRKTPSRSANSTTTSTACPDTSSTCASASALPNPKNSVPGPGGFATPSITTLPPTSTRARPPICTSEKVCGPVSSGTYVAVARNEKSAMSTPGGVASMSRSRPSGRCGCRRRDRACSRPAKKSVANVARSGGAVRSMSTPRSNRTSTRSPTLSRSASSKLIR